MPATVFPGRGCATRCSGRRPGGRNTEREVAPGAAINTPAISSLFLQVLAAERPISGTLLAMPTAGCASRVRRGCCGCRRWQATPPPPAPKTPSSPKLPPKTKGKQPLAAFQFNCTRNGLEWTVDWGIAEVSAGLVLACSALPDMA
eukprot:1299218-Rhodomonas_salina.1